jgi:hypothetical protein
MALFNIETRFLRHKDYQHLHILRATLKAASGLAPVPNPSAVLHGPGPAVLAARTADPIWPPDASDRRQVCSLTGNVVPIVIQAHSHGFFGAPRSAFAMTVSKNPFCPRRG